MNTPRLARIRVEPVLPDGWTVSTAYADVPPGGCAAFTLIAVPNGRIRGRVTEPGGTPWTWLVDIVVVDSATARTGRRESVRANQRGEFEFTALPPGKYLIGINLTRGPTAGTPYPPTYYPGTTKRDEATEVDLGAGALRDGINMQLPPPLPTGRVDVRIPGTSQPGEGSVCVSSEGSGARLYPQFEPGKAVSISVVAGVRYRLTARVARLEGDFESETVEVTATEGRRVLTLRATKPAQPRPPEDPCSSLFVR